MCKCACEKYTSGEIKLYVRVCEFISFCVCVKIYIRICVTGYMSVCGTKIGYTCCPLVLALATGCFKRACVCESVLV